VRRLRAMGIEIAHETGATWARGRLALSAAPFESLAEPIRVPAAVFYTLGHNRLKFCQPRIFFDLPALEIAGCETATDVERALRRAWQHLLRDLALGRERFSRLATLEVESHGTRLQLIPAAGTHSRWEVRSSDELQLPSIGPLADQPVAEPGQRRFRPLRGLESSLELDLALERAVQGVAERRPTPPRSEAGSPRRRRPRARVLALASDERLLADLGSALPAREIAVALHRDPARALAAFAHYSFDAVLLEAHVAREDGLEIALRVREIPGVEDLPVALIDARESAQHREAASRLGLACYRVKPISGVDLSALLDELLLQLTRRRFRRFRARLAARAAASELEDRTEQIARGGLCLRSARPLRVGEDETYSIALPAPYEPVHVSGRVIARVQVPGSSTQLAGVRLTGFERGSEERWIRVIEALARRESAKAPAAASDGRPGSEG